MQDLDYLAFCRQPSTPHYKPPDRAVDAHCHVFGPAAVFPFSPRRKYTPCDAPAETLFALRDRLGFARNVIVQATCHGTDNRALVDALNKAGDRARGIALVPPGIDDDELRALDRAGVRGVRFNFLKRLVDSAPKDQFMSIAKRVADLGWHVVVYFESSDLEELRPFLETLPTNVVIDHMGRPEVALGAHHERFISLLDLLQKEKFWVKVSGPERLTVAGPPYADVIPFARKLVETFPDRVLWGTDWPHPNMKSHMPDDGELVDFIPKIVPDADHARRLLVDNPHRLYWA
jgi:2-pyrone-4,6-dicarboxylate lactonase